MQMYRYDFVWYDDEDVRIYCTEYTVEKETKCGYWISLFSGFSFSGNLRKFVLKNARKKWANITKEGALTDFIARKERQILILTDRLAEANNVLEAALGLQASGVTL